MHHHDFKVGEDFFTTNGFKWRCTDKGARVIIAIQVEEEYVEHDPSWLKGPPYALAEIVFDEDDMPACHSTMEGMFR